LGVQLRYRGSGTLSKTRENISARKLTSNDQAATFLFGFARSPV
jgi:hypothetical protein